MEEVIKDANTVETTAPDTSTEATNESAEPTAEVVKTEGAEVKPEEKAKEETAKEEPWHKDPRFKKFLDDKKGLEERVKAFDGIEADPDFAAFLAYKRQKEAIAAEARNPKIDYSQMSAEEYAAHVEAKAKEAARLEYQNLVESNKKGDEITREAVNFAESVGVDKTTFQKEYGPKIMEYYNAISRKIGSDRMDAFVEAVPPKEVFKSYFFDKAGEIGVKKYKETVDKARKSSFDTGDKPRDEALPADARGRFDTIWAKAFGSATELPPTAFGKQG